MFSPSDWDKYMSEHFCSFKTKIHEKLKVSSTTYFYKRGRGGQKKASKNLLKNVIVAEYNMV